MGTKQTTGAPIFLFYLCVSIGVGNSTWRRSTWPGHWHNLIGADQPLPIHLQAALISKPMQQHLEFPIGLPSKHCLDLNFASLRSSNGNWWLQTKPATSFLFGPPVLHSSFNEDKRQTSGSPSSCVDAAVNLLFGTQLTKQKFFFRHHSFTWLRIPLKSPFFHWSL